MHKRKISTRAGAWVLSAAMLFNGMPLNVFAENAVFTLYKMEGNTADISADEKLQENLTTDKNGEILVENLPEGKYYFVETAAPATYLWMAEAQRQQ